MDIEQIKAKYDVKGKLEKQLGNVYPMKVEIEIPIRYIEEEYNEVEKVTYVDDLTSKMAVRLTMEVLYPNYPKEEVKNAMKKACLKFLEEFC